TRPMIFNGSGIQIGNAATGSTELATIGSNITLAGDVMFSMLNGNTAAPLLLTGNITEQGGPRSITKTSPTLLIVTGDNAFSGTITNNGGTLQIGNAGTTGWLGTGGIVNNACLVSNRSDTLVLTNNISGTGSFVQAGTGTTSLSGNVTYGGATTVSAGRLQLA